MNKIILVVGITVLVLISLGNTADALGVRPAKSVINFEPNTAKTISYRVVNNDHILLDVNMYVEGEIADLIKLDKTEAHLDETDDYREFFFTISFPEELPPGELKSKIIIEEKLRTVSIGESYISARLKLSHKIYVDVPYPKKYIEATLETRETETSVALLTNVENKGNEEIDKLKSEYGVYEEETKIKSAESEEKSLDLAEKTELRAAVEKDFGKGEFEVVSSVSYDENSLELTGMMIIGEALITVMNMNKYFVEGKINELSMDIKNNWNKKFLNVYAVSSLYKDSEKIKEIKSISFTLDKGESKKVSSYLDLRDLETGDYKVKIEIFFGDKKTEKEFDVEILSEEEFAEKTAKPAEINLDSNTIMVIIIIILAVIIIILVVKKGKRKKRIKRRRRQVYKC